MNRSVACLVAAVVLAPAVGLAASQAPSAGQAPAVNKADVDFMAGMIPHHAQAVLIAGWAPAHGARSDVRILCERIVVGQKDEIALMQMWLSDHGQPVPATDATHHVMKMGDTEHRMLMPGMLTDAELAQLDKARGPEFDRLFLTFMIKHHEGALKMVDALFESYGGAQDETVFRLASDIWADQQAEIERMQLMLSGGGFQP
jgi:uncharacterized protein (DUF305 family)